MKTMTLRWLMALALVAAVFSGCSDSTDAASVVTGQDSVVDTTREPDDVSEPTTAVEIGIGDDVEPGGDMALPPAIASAQDMAPSPAQRQAAQSAGAVPEPPTVATAATDVAEPSGTEVDQIPAPPSVEIVEIPIFPTDAQPGPTDSAAASAEETASSTSPDATVLATDDLEGCAGDCEIGGLDGDDIDDGLAEPVLRSESSATVEVVEDDRACPEGSAAECEERDAEQQVSLTTPDEAQQSNCELRPWERGCDGPIPEPEDYEAQPIVRDQLVEVAAGDGVFVPQELQELLLEDPNE